VEATGHSNFYDVTGNLMGVVKSCFLDWRDYPDDFGDEDRRDLMESLGPAEQYLKLLDADPDILQKEMTQRNGAFPELRRQADLFKDEGVIDRPIPFYIEKASQQVFGSEEQEAHGA
jgi:hypothetical protein